jgi:chromate transporter
MAGAVGILAPKIRASNLAGSFLAGVTAAAVALMLFVAWQLAQTALIDKWTAAIAILSLLLLLCFRLNASWLILVAALTGLALKH